MDKIKENTLYDKYPEFLKRKCLGPESSCMHWGICVGDGWYDIVDELCSEISKIKGVYAEQIKEKFGELRLYLFFDDNEFTGNKMEIHDIVKRYEIKSSKTCEITGKPGTKQKVNGWIKTLCDEECEKLQKGKISQNARSTRL